MITDEQGFISALNRVFGANKLNGYLSLDKARLLYRLTVRMLEENEKYNLTAITDPDKIILNHYADCAVLATVLPKGARVADVGCGAGFPTLPLAILREDLKITAIDSTAKRIAYVAASAEMLGLSNVRAVAMRAEDGGRNPEYREKFDFVTARAVAELRVLCELCLPYVKVGGQLLAMKGKNAEGELRDSRRAIPLLGGREPKIQTVSLKSDTEELSHPLVVITKKEKTPAAYPRPFAQISKKPL